MDLGTAQITIRGELGKSRQERRGWIVPFPGWLGEELAGWGQRRGLLAPAPPSEPSVHRVWIASGAPEEVWRRRPVHSFRRGVVTGLRAAGGEESLVGHASGSTTGDVYTDGTLLESRLRAVVALNPPPQLGGVLAMAWGG